MLDSITPVEIAPGTFWVGKRDPKSIFHSNPYLRVFESRHPQTRQRMQFNLLVDPGSSTDFAVVSSKTASIIGSLERVSALFINHQDPDVSSSAPLLMARYSPKAAILTSEDTFRLIIHMGLPRERFLSLDRFAQGITLPTGHQILPVPSPFCHFKGAVMLYDLETRVLFSGDLLGGLTPEGVQGIEADASDWAGIRAFHQMYMPTRIALARAVEAIRRLSPAPEIIAPQHGRILRGELIDEFLERLANLPVGLDLIEDAQEPLAAWSHVLTRILSAARDLLGHEVDARLSEEPSLSETLSFTDKGAVINARGRWTVEKILEILTANEPASIANILKTEAVAAADQMQLPTPHIVLEEQPAQTAIPVS
jgi:glyoxylase-like metal-dependent hydrolase (beta-lactamase superfamily II)